MLGLWWELLPVAKSALIAFAAVRTPSWLPDYSKSPVGLEPWCAFCCMVFDVPFTSPTVLIVLLENALGIGDPGSIWGV